MVEQNTQVQPQGNIEVVTMDDVMHDNVTLKTFSFRHRDGTTWINCFWRVRFRVSYIHMYPSGTPSAELGHYRCMFDVKNSRFIEFQANVNGDDIPQQELDHF